MKNQYFSIFFTFSPHPPRWYRLRRWIGGRNGYSATVVLEIWPRETVSKHSWAAEPNTPTWRNRWLFIFFRLFFRIDFPCWFSLENSDFSLKIMIFQWKMMIFHYFPIIFNIFSSLTRLWSSPTVVRWPRWIFCSIQIVYMNQRDSFPALLSSKTYRDRSDEITKNFDFFPKKFRIDFFRLFHWNP